jgi:hypothetical protein
MRHDRRANNADGDVEHGLIGDDVARLLQGRADFRRQMETDSALWGGFIRDAGIRME